MAGPGRGEDSVESVEVGLADRVELVVVATGAGNRQPQERLADDIDLVVDVADLFIEGIDRLVAVLDKAEVAGAEGGFVQVFAGIEPRLGEEVARDLLADELVIRDIGVEGADEVVAVPPRLGNAGITFAAMGVGIADEVHPVTGEVLAVPRRSQ